jgi:predicted amidohydrolase
MREIVTAALQMGPIQKADSRADVVARMIALLEQAHQAGAGFAVFPELALTTFFPRWYMEDQTDVDSWFEAQMPGPDTAALFNRDREGAIIGKYRKIHLPGHSEYDKERGFQHLEKRYFLPGDLGFPVWHNLGGIMGMLICNDRRWPEAYRVMGLQGVEMVTLGFNTPSVNSQMGDEGPQDRLFHHRLSCQSGAYQNATWVVAVAKAGIEDGHPMIGGSLIIDPNGKIVAETATEADEMIIHACDLDACNFGKTTIFDFKRHRRIEHYGLITERTGARPPAV